MIKVTNLTKIFKTKKRNSVIALNDISFTLPNKGFVFVVGKSGSGKSTLLNLLGACDTPTNGSIEVDGRNITDLKNKEYSYFRNYKIGLIYQDYHLLDKLTVFENVNLALKIKREENNELIFKYLEIFGLKNYENRYPKELSGGQKQRVAIIRSIIKNPDIVLADEPTGNLDEETSKQVLDILKEISKDKLVLIVTHDKLSAKKYADRIIELSEGKIINDYEKSSDIGGIKIENNTLYLPLHKLLTREESHEINSKLHKKEIVSLKQVDYEFKPTKEIFEENNNFNYKKSHLRGKDNLKFGFKFLKSSALLIAIYSIVIGMLSCVLGLTQTITNFDSSKTLKNELIKNGQDEIVLQKTHIKVDDKYIESPSKVMHKVEDNDIKTIKNTGYKGDIYPLYTISLPYNSSSLYKYKRLTYFEACDVYISETLGTLVVDEEYLVDKYGVNNKLDIIETKVEPYGVYITDYIADSMIKLSPLIYKDYNSILENKQYNASFMNAYINGIIKTNYKETYKDTIKYLLSVKKEEEMSKVLKDKKVNKFIDELNQVLAFGYSFNKNFYNDYINSKVCSYLLNTNGEIEYNGNKFFESYEYAIGGFNKLKNNDAIIGINEFNKLTGSNYTLDNLDNFEPCDLNLNLFQEEDKKRSEIDFTTKLHVIGLKENKGLQVSNELFIDIANYYYYDYGVCLDSLNHISEIVDVANKNGFTVVSSLIQPLKSVTEIVDTFSILFYVLFVILLICCVAILISYSLKSIKEKLYEIGVLKSLGATNFDLYQIFSIQTYIVSFISAILFVIGVYSLVGFANELLIFSATKFSRNTAIVKGVKLLLIDPIIVILDIVFMFIISLLSYVFPMIKLRNIKPQNVLNQQK